MTEQDLSGLLKHFSGLPDPRDLRGIRHELVGIMCISILAVICGANTYSQIHQYALAQEVWLRTFLELPSGIPQVRHIVPASVMLTYVKIRSQC